MGCSVLLLVLVVLILGRASPLRAAPPASSSSLAAALAPIDLRAEHLVSPWGVDTLTPLLSWVAIPSAGQRAIADRIELATDATFADASAIVWDSGAVPSTITSACVPGSTLAWDAR
jgi:hypothetical protein